MSKFFKKIGRFFKKIWEVIKKVIATILAIIVVVALIGCLIWAIPGNVAAAANAGFWKAFSATASGMMEWLAAILPAWSGTWVSAASIQVRTWAIGEWLGAAAVSMGVGFGTMPNTMAWAIRRQVDGARYVGETIIEAAGDLAETTVEVVAGVANTAASAVLSSPLLLVAAVGAFVYFKSRSGPAPSIPGVTHENA